MFHKSFSFVATAAVVIIFSLAIAAVSFSSHPVSAQISEVQKVLAAREATLAALVKKQETLQLQQCQKLLSWTATADSCATPSCGSVFSAAHNFKCTADFGTSTSCTSCAGLVRSLNRSTVIFAPKTQFTGKQSGAIQGLLATSSLYTEEIIKHPSIKSWTGAATYLGTSTWWPGSPRGRANGKCDDYDPRLRSWYVASASGPKDVVLVLDTSGSMLRTSGSSTRIELLINAVKALVGSFTINDFFSIVTFSDVGKIITNGGKTELLQATQANLKAAKDSVDNLAASGGTVFETGFKKAFEVFRGSTEMTSGCSRIVLFLTDGVATDSSTIEAYVTSQQSTLSSRKATVFTFSMSSASDDVVPRALACAHGGIWSKINDGANPLDAMSQYYKFLAHGIDTKTPRWVEPYVDAFGMGRMTTCSMPYYERTSTPIFVGVVEIDVPMPELTKFAAEADVVKELTSRSSSCPSTSIKECHLQFLRNESGYECPGKKSLAECRSTSSFDEIIECSPRSIGGSTDVNALLCDPINPSNMLAKTGNKDWGSLACCSSSGCSSLGAPTGDDGGSGAGATIGILVACILAVPIAIYVFYLYKQKQVKAAGEGGGDSKSKRLTNDDSDDFSGGGNKQKIIEYRYITNDTPNPYAPTQMQSSSLKGSANTRVTESQSQAAAWL